MRRLAASIQAFAALCLLGGCFPSFEGLSSGQQSNRQGGSNDSGSAGSGDGDEPAASDGALEGDSPQHVLGCDALGKVGEWQSILPANLDIACPETSGCDRTGSRALVLDPHNAGTVYLGVSGQGLWKTSDCGETWTLANVGKNGILVGATDFAHLEIDPSDSRTLYTRGESNEYKSTDGGASWEIIWPANPPLTNAPPILESLVIDPGDHQHLLIDFQDACTAQYAPACIAESHDGGVSWGLLKTPGAGGWARPWFIDSTRWLLAQGGGLWRSSDSGATWQTLADSGVPRVSGRIYRATGGAYYLGSQNGVLFSPDGALWSIIANSGQTNLAGVVGDGTTVYTSMFGLCYDYGTDLQAYASAPEKTGRPWTNLPSPLVYQGAYNLGYDPDHHVLYSSNCSRGFWRVVTR
jgi:hypothetical protein